MVEWIREVSPDLIGLQENEPMRGPVSRPIQSLAPKLAEYQVVLPKTTVPLLIRRGRFGIGEHGVALISREYHQRYLSWCWLTHTASGRRLLLANTHLDPRRSAARARARVASVQEILDVLARLNPDWTELQLLTGDLNTGASETNPIFREPLTELAGSGLRSSTVIAERNVSAVPGAATVNNFGAMVNQQWRYRAVQLNGLDYDYVWVGQQARVVDWQVVTGPNLRHIDGVAYFAAQPLPSDHCPVQATIAFGR